MYVCVLDREGKTLLHRNLPCRPEALLCALAPFRDRDLVVGCECLFAWYWLADLCEAEGIPFALGHALGMRAIHGSVIYNIQGVRDPDGRREWLELSLERGVAS